MRARAGKSLLRRKPRLRAGRTQLLLALAGLGLGLAVPAVPGGPQVPARQVVDMLLSLGVGLLGVSAVIFSLLFLVVQWVHTSFSPRMTLFRRAPIVWRTFAFAIGLAVYCVTAALTIGTAQRVSLAVPAVAGILLTLLVWLLRTLQLRAFAAIQLAQVLDAITDQGRDLLQAIGPTPSQPEPDSAPCGLLPPWHSSVTWPEPVVVVQQIDVDRLVRAARAADAVIVVHAIPGTTLPHGAVVADLHGTEVPPSAVLAALVTDVEGSFDQDPKLAFRLLADIALRALSPAVNDPATAVQALDSMEDLLLDPASARSGPFRATDTTGTIRVVTRLPGWNDFLHIALDDVIPAAVSSPMVLIRLRALLMRLQAEEHPEREDLLRGRLAWVEQELADRFPLVWHETVRDSPEGR
ncbi:DUF2254 family protein [Streptomyces sp. NPDC048643]|uniref:DUF2254 family protein n=1 Tax=Streptomyces sp. NPDC048643 TaxID=3155637 RepID=UPI003437E737